MASAAAVEAKGVTKVFGAGQDAVRALDDVSVTIRQNEFFTLLGPSGCGKTTLLRLIAGFEFPTEGEILLYGEDIAPLPPFKRPVHRLKLFGCFPHMTVGQNIGFGLEMRSSEPRPSARGEDAGWCAWKSAQPQDQPISGGQQRDHWRGHWRHSQGAAAGRAVVSARLQAAGTNRLKRLQDETGITFIFVTHDQEEALTMSDRVAVMSRGHILQVGSPREIYDHPAERFVANFIGETNFLQAELAGTSGGKANVRLTCGGAALAATLPQGFAPKDKVTIVVRPTAWLAPAFRVASR